MHALPAGVTGFWDSRKPADRVPELPAREFKAACYSVCQAVGGSLSQLVERNYPGNYHAASVVRRERSVTVLCNAHYRIVGLCSLPPEHTRGLGPGRGSNAAVRLANDFVDDQELADHFTASGFDVLSVAELAVKPAPQTLSLLRAAELDQIKAWRVTRVGDILFHNWD